MSDAEPLAASLVERASVLGLRLAVAESLTGGLLAATIVSVPGASRVFSGAIVAYDTALKHSLLGVDAELLRARGPVDDEVARQMARGVRESCTASLDDIALARRVDIGIATTGVAGPDPDPHTGQAAGTVWIGVSSSKGERAVLLSLEGDRGSIRGAAVRTALSEMISEIETL